MIYIIQNKKVRKQFEKLPLDIKRLYLKFLKDIQAKNGQVTSLRIKGYKDHRLKGKWQRYRALRLNRSYRVIYKTYKENNNNQFVEIERVSKHDYSQ